MYASSTTMRRAHSEQNLIQLTDPDLQEINEARLTYALQTASNEIDGYLAQRYSLPINPVPKLLADMAVDIAFFTLHLAQAATISPDIRKRYEDRIGHLSRLASGALALETVPANAGSASTSEVLFQPVEKHFTRTSLRGC